MTAALTSRKNPALARVPWRSTVQVLEDDGPVELVARQLGRTSLLVEGELGLVVGRALTLELEIAGERFQVLAHVEASVLCDDVAVSLLRFGATSPRGNDLIASLVRHALSHAIPPVRFPAARRYVTAVAA